MQCRCSGLCVLKLARMLQLQTPESGWGRPVCGPQGSITLREWQSSWSQRWSALPQDLSRVVQIAKKWYDGFQLHRCPLCENTIYIYITVYIYIYVFFFHLSTTKKRIVDFFNMDFCCGGWNKLNNPWSLLPTPHLGPQHNISGASAWTTSGSTNNHGRAESWVPFSNWRSLIAQIKLKKNNRIGDPILTSRGIPMMHWAAGGAQDVPERVLRNLRRQLQLRIHPCI